MSGIILPILTSVTMAVSGVSADQKADSTPVKVTDSTNVAKAKLVGAYPNHTDFSVHGNPALQHSSQYSQWTWAAVGRTENGGRNAHVFVNKDVFGDVTFSFWYVNKTNKNTGSSSNTTNLGVSFPLTRGVLFGTNLTTTRKNDGNEKSGYTFGVVGLTHTERYLLRLGAMCDNSEKISLAGEGRIKIGGCEAGISGKVTLVDGEKPVSGAGVQIRKGKNIINAGRGGPDWKDVKLHWRHVLNKKTLIDVHLRGKGKGVVRKPGTVLVGITRLF